MEKDKKFKVIKNRIKLIPFFRKKNKSYSFSILLKKIKTIKDRIKLIQFLKKENNSYSSFILKRINRSVDNF